MAEDVTVELAREYARARREGVVSGRTVRTRSIQADLRFLKSALGWAVLAERHGRPYLNRNRLAAWHLPRKRDIRRPLIAAETIRALLAAPPRVHPRLTLMILRCKVADPLYGLGSPAPRKPRAQVSRPASLR